MTEVMLKDDLKPVHLAEIVSVLGRRRLNEKFTKGKLVRPLHPGADVYHTNYLAYLCDCWSLHYGAMIDPVYFWQMILCELATTVKGSPEAYRSHFTDSAEEKDILIPTNDPVQINTNALCTELRSLIKEDIDIFLPEFSTHTESSRLAHSAAFCDAVSPFYNYSMFLYGIPRVRVMGTGRDWEMLRENLEKLKAIFSTKASWLDGIIGINFMSTDPEFWKAMLALDRCGSGSQFEVNGWITKFFMERPRFALPENFSAHVSEVNYRNVSTKKNYVMFSGLFSSRVSDGYLIPDYSMVINEKINEPVKNSELTMEIKK